MDGLFPAKTNNTSVLGVSLQALHLGTQAVPVFNCIETKFVIYEEFAFKVKHGVSQWCVNQLLRTC